MKVTFLYHSSYFVEMDTCCLLFDYYQGDIPQVDKPLYVFASHHHGDHYAPEIFAQLGMDNVWYVLANCIRLSAKRKAALGIDDSHVFRLAAGRHLSLGGLDIQTYRSTDAGVAFLVEVEGKTIFHAGDLHWWHWAEEDAAWNQAMERDFKKECAKLQGKPVDVGFFVLDPRQEGEFWWGFDWWMRTMEVKHAFPMHSWEDYTLVQTLRTLPCSAPYRDRVVEVSGKGQDFSWED